MTKVSVSPAQRNLLFGPYTNPETGNEIHVLFTVSFRDSTRTLRAGGEERRGWEGNGHGGNNGSLIPGEGNGGNNGNGSLPHPWGGQWREQRQWESVRGR